MDDEIVDEEKTAPGRALRALRKNEVTAGLGKKAVELEKIPGDEDSNSIDAS